MGGADAPVRLDAYVAGIEDRLAAGLPLDAAQTEVHGALTALLAAEADARNAFAAFYAAGETAGGGALTVPADVADRIQRWIGLRQAWDELVARRFPADAAGAAAAPAAAPPALFTPPAPLPAQAPTRLRAALPDLLRLPTARPAKDAFTALFAGHLWQADAANNVVWARQGRTTVQIDTDDALGFGPEQAIQQVTRHGASVAQTFLALIGLYLERNPGGDPDAYVSVGASDLLRYQQRRETPRGGYHREDVLAKGRDVYLLSRLSLPFAAEGDAPEDAPARALHIGRLISVDAIDVADLGESANPGLAAGSRSLVRFRYHLGRDVFDWVTGGGAGDAPQYAAISGRLLTYHPVRQKYQILLGFCLACYDRAAARRDAAASRRVGLPALLSLAGIPVPERRIAEFLSSIEDALNELAGTGVVPGLRLERPSDWPDLLARRAAREVIARSTVAFPPLPAPVPLLASGT